MENSKFFVFGEPFELYENGSLIIDLDAKAIELNPGDPNHLRRLERVLKRRLLNEIEPLIGSYAEKLGVTVNRITIKKLRSRWGSCSANGNLNFNLWLVCLPRELIRYIVWHEVAHLKENNHRRGFRELMRSEFENYREMERRLKEYWPVLEKRAFNLGKAPLL